MLVRCYRQLEKSKRAKELGREDELFELVEQTFGDEPIDETAINDYIWFEVDEEMGLWEE